jgi:hypothetical protein
VDLPAFLLFFFFADLFVISYSNSPLGNFKVSLASLISALSCSMGQDDVYCCWVSARPKSFQSS